VLPRSSTGERENPYTSIWTGPGAGPVVDGPRNVHIVLLDNGRTRVLADPKGRDALRCIRCSACLNVCPVYERTGGHSYGSVYPGPIGAVLTPQLRGTDSDIDKSLPFASSLCGACFDVCPVRIDIPSMLVHLRTRVVDESRGGVPSAEQLAMKAASWTFADHRRLGAVGTAVSTAGKVLRSQLMGGRQVLRRLPWPASVWSSARDVPVPPKYQERISSLRDRGAIETIGRGRGQRVVLARQFYELLGKPGDYTRRKGLDHETNKQLLLRHITENAQIGSPMADLQGVLPALSRGQLRGLLDELRQEGKADSEGRTRATRWYPLPR